MSYLRDRLSPPLESVREEEKIVEPWRKALLDAAELIRVKGLANGLFYDTSLGSFCTIGAIAHVTTGSWELYENEEVRAAEKKLMAFLHVVSIPDWNDAFERTKEDVIRALTDCARS